MNTVKKEKVVVKKVKTTRKKTLPKKKSSKLKKILLAIFVILLMGIGFAAYTLWQTGKEIPQVGKTVNLVLVAISDEEYEKAYDMFGLEFRITQNYNDFKKTLTKLHPIYNDYQQGSLKLVNFNVFYPIGKPAQLTYIGEFSYNDGQKAQVKASFLFKDQKWEIIGIFVMASPDRLDKYINPQIQQ